MNDYLEFTITCKNELKEILTAELGYLPYEGFIEQEDGITVYIPEELYDAEPWQEVLDKYEIKASEIATKKIPQQNWNAQWEASFQPIQIDDKIIVRAPFHEPPQPFVYDLLIQPKMSFGTGHHETTRLMMKNMLGMTFNNQTVFDFGCGTGILAVLAEKMGAKSIYAIDIDEWAFDNVGENVTLNQCKHIQYERGDLSLAAHQTFDIVLANINKNVLMASFKSLTTITKPGGHVLISGFYTHDVDDLLEEATQHGFKLITTEQENQWVSLLLSVNAL
jgi:ribosomal protein L11 methyltransferase